jgi:hypothetical protein
MRRWAEAGYVVRVKLALAPLALAVVRVARGGRGGSSSSSSSPSPKDWAQGLCSSITTWSDSVKSAGQSIQKGNLEGQPRERDHRIRTPQDVPDDLKGLGKPNTDAGQRPRRRLRQVGVKLSPTSGRARARAAAAASGIGLARR